MNRSLIVPAAFLTLATVILSSGCSKERIVESTQYIKDVEYVQLPGDTVLQIQHVYDTVRILDTVFVGDTVTTVGTAPPNQFMAIAAVQYYNDPLVIEFAQENFGLNDGWIFYLSAFQLSATKQSTNVYDVGGYIDFWAPDWSGYYPLEFMWRITYKSGDAANPQNWELSEPPAAAAGHQPGLRQVPKSARPDRNAQ